VELLGVGGHSVLVVTVPPVAPRVVTTPDGRLLRRVGGSNRPLRGESVAWFLRTRAADAVSLAVGSAAE
jgi:ATP-dependent DNA helicase RecG